MITKTHLTEHGDAVTNTEITHLDSGQVVLRIKGSLSAGAVVHTHEHVATLGAEDAKDGITGISHCATCGRSEVKKSTERLSQAQLQTLIQTELDTRREQVVQVLTGRATHAAIMTNLV